MDGTEDSQMENFYLDDVEDLTENNPQDQEFFELDAHDFDYFPEEEDPLITAKKDRTDFNLIFQAHIDIAKENRRREAEEASLAAQAPPPPVPVAVSTQSFPILGKMLASNIGIQTRGNPWLHSFDPSVVRVEWEESGVSPRDPQLLQEPFNEDTENRRFRLLTQTLGLLQTPTFPAKVVEQLILFDQIRTDFDSEVRKEKESQSKPEEWQPIERHFRFGDSLKDVFQGFDFEEVCRVVLVALAIKTKGLTLEIVGDDAIIRIAETLSGNRVEELMSKYLFASADVNWVDLVGNLLVPGKMRGIPNLFAESHQEGVLSITKEELLRLFESEQLEWVAGGLGNPNTCFEFEAEPILYWVANNLLQPSYVPYLYSLTHFQRSFLDLYGALLNVQGIGLGPADLIEEAFGSTLRLFPRETRDPERPIFLHKRLTNLKVCRELVFDFCCLSFKFGLHRGWRESWGWRELLARVVELRERTPPPPASPGLFDFPQFVAQNSSFLQATRDLLTGYLRGQLPIPAFDCLHKFLNSPESLLVVKRTDPSKFIDDLLGLNRQFLDYLSSAPLSSSVQFVKKDSTLMDTFREHFLEPGDSIPENLLLPVVSICKAHLLYSLEVIESFTTKVREEQTALQNVVCFENVRKYWRALPGLINDIHFPKEHQTNQTVNSDLRFTVDEKGKRVALPKATREKVHNRKFTPEHMFLLKDFKDLWPLIEGIHWKVQNGLIAWYCLFVEPFSFKAAVLGFLREMKLERVKTRSTAIKFFGAISKLFKLLEDAQHLDGFESAFPDIPLFYEVPLEVMCDLDTMFGFCEETKTENSRWDVEFFEHLHEWMNRKTAEKLFGVDMAYDFRLCFAQLTSDMKKTLSHGSYFHREVLLTVERGYWEEKPRLVFGLFDRLNEKSQESGRYKYLDMSNEVGNQHSFPTYDRFCNNFYNLSAAGSAKSWQVDSRESQDLLQLQKTEPATYHRIKNGQRRSTSTASTKTSDQPDQKGISKTLGFALAGKELPLWLIDVYGENYKPELSCFIKHEHKKLRLVINADMVSFSKQSYIHDWLKAALSPLVSGKINSFMDQRLRLLSLVRMQSTLNFEKWCVPIDLKDFHHHFGASHYKTFGEVLLRRAEDSVLTEETRRNLVKILRHFPRDLSTGRLTYFLNTSEKGLFATCPNRDKNCRVDCKSKKDKEGEYQYTLDFDVNNGLMSGWKMTSLFGSTFNLTLNSLSQFFVLVESGDLCFDLNVLGDDTHLKRRFLASSANHVAFVNMTGKIAHPDKQTISTVASEFLKKKINTLTRRVTQSYNRTWSSLLFTKDSKKNVLKDKNFAKDAVDLFNLFLARINHPHIVTSILERRIFAEHFLQFANIREEGNNDQEKREDRSRMLTEIQCLLDSPTFFSGFMGGRLRSQGFPWSSGSLRTDVQPLFRKVETRHHIRVAELDLRPGQCRGIAANLNGVLSRFVHEDQGWKTRFRVEMLRAEAEELFEGKADYYVDEAVDLPENKNFRSQKEYVRIYGIAEPDQEGKLSPTQVYPPGHSDFDVADFLEFTLRHIQEQVDRRFHYAGVIGELIYHNERVSRTLKKLLNELKRFNANPWPMIQALKGLCLHSDLTFQIAKQTFEKLSGNIFLEMATSREFGLSVSRNFGTDEMIGFLNSALRKTFVFYLIKHPPSALDLTERERNIKEAIITVDLYFHEHAADISRKILDIFEAKVGRMAN